MLYAFQKCEHFLFSSTGLIFIKLSNVSGLFDAPCICTLLPSLPASASTSLILTKWNELCAYFSCAEYGIDQRAKLKAQVIKEILVERTNFLWLTFLAPIISDFERVNSFFQATCIDPRQT